MTKEEIKRTVPNIPGIYRIYNIDTNKSYIGQAVKLKKRLLEHLGTFPKNNLQHIAIYRAFSCHGEEKFSFEILYKVDFEYNGKEELKSILDEKEKYYIKEYNSYKNGYNSTEGGDYGVLGFRHTEETKLHIKEKILEQRQEVEKDNTNWIKCKDWDTGYEYIAISQSAMAKIINECREGISKCLNKIQNNIKSRYTFCFYREEMPVISKPIYSYAKNEKSENYLKVAELLSNNPKIKYREVYEVLKISRSLFNKYKKDLGYVKEFRSDTLVDKDLFIDFYKNHSRRECIEHFNIPVRRYYKYIKKYINK